MTKVPALLKPGFHSDEVAFRNATTQIWFPDESLRGHATHVIGLCQEILDRVPCDGQMIGRLLWTLNIYLPGEGAKLAPTVSSHTASGDGVADTSDPGPSMFSQEDP